MQKPSGIDLSCAWTSTPATGMAWRTLSTELRMACVETHLLFHSLRCVSAGADGVVILQLTRELPAAKRGALLLFVESKLRELLDNGITAYLEAADDRNALRKLRGVTINA